MVMVMVMVRVRVRVRCEALWVIYKLKEPFVGIVETGQPILSLG